jgi:hypothetical protein
MPSISNLNIKMYNGQKYLSTTVASEFKEVVDIGAVHESIQSTNEEFIGDIVGIVSISNFYSCISCSAKVQQSAGSVGCCGKCGLKQKISRCKNNHVAQINVEQFRKTVTVFGDIIKETTCDMEEYGDDIEMKLLSLMSKKFKIKNNVVVEVNDVEQV